MRNLAFIAICLVVFCIPWQEMAIFSEVLSVSFVLGGLTIFLSALAVVMNLRIRKLPPALVVLTLYVVVSTASMFWSMDFDISRGSAFTYLQVFVLAWLIYEFADTQGRLVWLMLSYIAGACLSLATMFLAVPGYVASWDVARVSGGGMNANDLAGTLCLAIIMAVYLAMASAGKGTLARKLLWGFVPCAAVGVCMTGSRMGILVLVGSLLIMAWQAKASGFKAIIILLVVAGGTAYYLPRFIESGVMERVAEGTEARSFQDRLVLWQSGLEYWASHPLQGCGLGCFPLAIAPKVPRPDVAHNTFVTVLVETGIVGFSLATLFGILVFSTIVRMPRQERVLWLGLFVVWGACAMVLTWDYRKDTWFLYGLVMAHYAVVRSQQLLQPKAISPKNQRAVTSRKAAL
ncbi:MAG: O-antigen ligase family protein [Thermoguttaceae bacterium]